MCKFILGIIVGVLLFWAWPVWAQERQSYAEFWSEITGQPPTPEILRKSAEAERNVQAQIRLLEERQRRAGWYAYHYGGAPTDDTAAAINRLTWELRMQRLERSFPRYHRPLVGPEWGDRW